MFFDRALREKREWRETCCSCKESRWGKRPRRALSFSPGHLASRLGVAQTGCPSHPQPCHRYPQRRGGPLGMNGPSDRFQKLQPSHKGQWERENPSSSLFSHIMANNLAIQWRVGR